MLTDKSLNAQIHNQLTRLTQEQRKTRMLDCVSPLIKEQLEIENDFVYSSVHGIIDNQEKISQLANKYLVDWNIDRLSKVDKAILSLGIYELIYTEVPSVVAINEAIELSKKYSDEKVTKMINATLDKIYHEED